MPKELDISAFPRPFSDSEYGGMLGNEIVFSNQQSGMTLLDYFAAKAMQSSLTHIQNQVFVGAHDAKQIYSLACDSYLIAHAMLRARVAHI